MDRVIQKFTSFEASDEADRAYYRSLTPQQRLDILLDLVAAHQEASGEAAQGFARESNG